MDLVSLPSLAAATGEPITSGFSAWAAWIVLFAPLFVAFLVACVPAIRKAVNLAAGLAIASVALGLILTLFCYFLPALQSPGVVYEMIVPWVTVDGTVLIAFGTRMDALSITMSLVVTGVGLAIFVYALGYMHGDPSKGRFFGKFALFVFSMLGIVVSPNFFQTFIFWELVGVSSYLLIGYYWQKDSAGQAAKKAFMTNRVGDFGFLIGILMIWAAVGSLTGVVDPGAYSAFDFTVIEKTIEQVGFEGLFQGGVLAAAIAAALVFCGAMGKSAQFPLHVWLPDAMEGPTPVSALMHAATMVAAGIYLVIRCNFVFYGAAWAPTLICWLGGITAFIAASMAITQNDIKKVLAYSTLSQLGYMTMALGAGAYTAAMFHLTTHAFFKALLFLCAGSVIHGCHHEQDMRHMGGLRKLMPSTYKTWIIGTIALTALAPIAGWWSKDEILGSLLGTGQVWGSPFLLLVGLVVAAMTAFYMWRATYMTFAGEYRGHHEAHESPKVMTVPLWALAIFSLFIGFIGIPDDTIPGLAHSNVFAHWLHHWHKGGDAVLHFGLAFGATVVAWLGFLAARAIYRESAGKDPLPQRLGAVWTTWNRLYYIDDFYAWLVGVVQQGIARCAWFVERWVLIQGVINNASQTVRVTGDRVRRVQAGRLGGYVTSFVLGAAIVGLLVLLHVGMANAAGGK
ncbi:MAG: NADH-quinone oxidoreductase subunit L [Planctomycetota bacterium]|nr:NADH-quinone oxidoreductase subunit L [Planctomycetota bacterium]